MKPSAVTESGHRIYNEDALSQLQQILFFRELDFPLNEIKNILHDPAFHKTEALRNHKELLKMKRDRLDQLIILADRTLKGENTMSFEEFDMGEIEAFKKKYEKEVKKRWGNSDAYAESREKSKHYGKEQWQEIEEESSKILRAFAEKRDKAPESKEVQELVDEWKNFITARFYHCTIEILQGLGIMYVEDERFSENMNGYGEGTAELMSEAIKIYCLREE